jgi:hypothetical protein
LCFLGRREKCCFFVWLLRKKVYICRRELNIALYNKDVNINEMNYESNVFSTKVCPATN